MIELIDSAQVWSFLSRFSQVSETHLLADLRAPSLAETVLRKRQTLPKLRRILWSRRVLVCVGGFQNGQWLDQTTVGSTVWMVGRRPDAQLDAPPRHPVPQEHWRRSTSLGPGREEEGVTDPRDPSTFSEGTWTLHSHPKHLLRRYLDP